MSLEQSSSPDQSAVLEMQVDQPCGQYIGHCKWFYNKLGYGFIVICSGDRKGQDIFVHHSGLNPLNSNFKTLFKGEYVQFNIVDGKNGLQAVDVTGINGGPLMCDNVTSSRGSFEGGARGRGTGVRRGTGRGGRRPGLLERTVSVSPQE